jgi:putative redox protein
MKVTVKQKDGYHFIGSGAEYPGDLLIDAAAHVGGKGRGFRPPELMMYSIAGCMGIHGYEALLEAGKSVDSVEVETGGERRDEYPKMFTKIVLKVRIKGSGLTEKDVKDAFDEALNKTCSIAAMVNKVAPISLEFQIG